MPGVRLLIDNREKRGATANSQVTVHVYWCCCSCLFWRFVFLHASLAGACRGAGLYGRERVSDEKRISSKSYTSSIPSGCYGITLLLIVLVLVLLVLAATLVHDRPWLSTEILRPKSLFLCP